MKRNFKLLGVFIALMGISLIALQCSKDDDGGTKYYKITGAVTLSDGTIADGAIVTLSDAPNGANVIATTLSNATGAYSFMGLMSGTYYLNARWEPGNNNLKTTDVVILTGAEVSVDVTADATQNISMVGAVSGGDGAVDETWAWDNTHSTIEFEFPYDAFNAIFTGHFSRAGIDALDFDETDPSSMVLKAWVDITSVETGAPSGICGHGRDGITGCIQSTFGLELNPADSVDAYCEDGTLVTGHPNETLADYSGDLWGDASATSYTKQSSIVGISGVALFEITDVMPFGTGYKADADFTFAGTTASVDFYFSFVEGYINTGGTKEYSSFYGWFKFDPADFGVSSGHIGDSEITVKLSAQFNISL